jgi:hypothetical protein
MTTIAKGNYAHKHLGRRFPSTSQARIVLVRRSTSGRPDW